MKKFFILALAALGLLATAQAQQTQHEQDSTQEWETISTNEYHFAYPATWEFDNSGQMGTRFILFTPLEDPNDTFRENLSLVITDLSAMEQVPELGDYVEGMRDYVRSVLPQFKQYENRRLERDDLLIYSRLVYTGVQEDFSLKTMQLVTIQEGKAYVITYTAEEAQFEHFMPLVDKLFDGFKLGPSPEEEEE